MHTENEIDRYEYNNDSIDATIDTVTKLGLRTDIEFDYVDSDKVINSFWQFRILVALITNTQALILVKLQIHPIYCRIIIIFIIKLRF